MDILPRKTAATVRYLLLGVAGGHHVLGVKHLLGELRYGEGSVALAATGSEWSEAGHEEVETGEGDHVHCQLPKVGVQLAGEPEAGSDPGHCEADEMVQVTIGWRCQL